MKNTAIRATTAVRRDRSFAVAPSAADAAASGAATPLDRPLKNERAMLQLGILFGLAYLGFLAVWFWSTRFRRVRPTLRL